MKTLDLDKDLELIDFYDNKYVAQLSDDRIIDFLRKKHEILCSDSIEVFPNEDSNFISVDSGLIYKKRDFYWIDRNIKRGWQYQLPEITTHEQAAIPLRREGSDLVGFYMDYEDMNSNRYMISDFSINRPMYFGFCLWDNTDTLWIGYMYNNFGEDYRKDLFNTRKIYRDYYIAKEKAKIKACVNAMTDYAAGSFYNKHKTEDTYVASGDISIVEDFFALNDSRFNNIINVTNFQCLKNENIPDDKKDHCQRTILIRRKINADRGELTAVEEYQARMPKSLYINGQFELRYPKKNDEVLKNEYRFDDYTLVINKSGYENCYNKCNEAIVQLWRSVMYRHFGEEYMQSMLEIENEKIDKYISSFDKETSDIGDIFESFSINENLIGEESPQK